MADSTFTRGPARRPAPTNADGSLRFDPPAAAPAPAAPPVAAPAPAAGPPATPQVAEARFFARYGRDLIAALLGLPERPQPTTIAQWIRLAEATRDTLQARERGRAWAEEPEA